MQEHPAANGEEIDSNSVRESEPGDAQTEDDLLTSRPERSDEYTDVEEVVEEDVEEIFADDGGVEPADSDSAPGPGEAFEVEDDDVEEDEEEDDVVEEGAEEADAADEELDVFEEEVTIERSTEAIVAPELSENAEADLDGKDDTVADNAIAVDEKSPENAEEEPATVSVPKEINAQENEIASGEGTGNLDVSVMAAESMSITKPDAALDDPASTEAKEHASSLLPTTSIADKRAKAETVVPDHPMSTRHDSAKNATPFGQTTPSLFGNPKPEQAEKSSGPIASIPRSEGAKTSGDVWKSTGRAGAELTPKPLFGSGSSFGASPFNPVESKTMNLGSEPVKTRLFGVGAPVSEKPGLFSLEKATAVDDNLASSVVEPTVAVSVPAESKAQENENAVKEGTGNQERSFKAAESMSVTKLDSTSSEPAITEAKEHQISSIPITSSAGTLAKAETLTRDNSMSAEPDSGKNPTAFGQAAPPLFGSPKHEQAEKAFGLIPSVPWGERAKASGDIWKSAGTAGAKLAPKPLFGSASSFGALQFKPAESTAMNLDTKAAGTAGASVPPKPLFGSASAFGAPQFKPAESKAVNLDAKGTGTAGASVPSMPLFGSASSFGAPQFKSWESTAVNLETKAAGTAGAGVPPKPLFGSVYSFGAPQFKSAESKAMNLDAKGAEATEAFVPPKALFGNATSFGAPQFKPAETKKMNLDTNATSTAGASVSPKPLFGSTTSFGTSQFKPVERKAMNMDTNSAGTAGASVPPKPLFGSTTSFGAPSFKPAAMNLDTKAAKAPLFGMGAPATEKSVSFSVEKAIAVDDNSMANAVKASVAGPLPDKGKAQENENAVEEGTGNQELSTKAAEPMSITKPDAPSDEPASMEAKEHASSLLPTTSIADTLAKAETVVPDHPMSTRHDSAKNATPFGQTTPSLFGNPKPEQAEKSSGPIASVPRSEGAKTSGDVWKSTGRAGAELTPKPLFGSGSSFGASPFNPVESKTMNLDTKAMSTPLFGLGVPVTKKPVSFSVIPSFQTSLSPGAPNFVPGAAKHHSRSLSAGDKSPDSDVAKKTAPTDSAPAEKPSKEWSHLFDNVSLLIVKRSAPEVKKSVVGKKEGTYKLELFKDKNGTFLNVVRTDTKEEVYLSLKVGADVLKCGRIKGRPDRLAVTRLGSAVPKVTTEDDPTKFFAVFPTEEDCSSLLAAFSRAIAVDLPSSEGDKSKEDPSVKVHEAPAAKPSPAKSARPPANTGKSNAPVPTISKSAKLAAKKRLALQRMQLAKSMKMKGKAIPSSVSAGVAHNPDKPQVAAISKPASLVASVGTSTLAGSSKAESGNAAFVSGAKRQAGVAFESAPTAKKKKGGGATGKQNLPATASSGKNFLTATPMEVTKPVAPAPLPGKGPTVTEVVIPQVPDATKVGGIASTNDETKLLRKQLEELTSKYDVAVRNAKELEKSAERKLAEALKKQNAQESSLLELARNLDSMESKSTQLTGNCDVLSQIADEVLDSAIEGLDVVSSRLKEAISRGSTDAHSSLGQCRPHSAEDYFDRLWSFRPSKWYGFMEKGVIDPLECALRGWYNSGPNQLTSSDGATIKFDVQTLSNPDLYNQEVNRVRALILGKGHALLSGWLANSCPNEFRTLRPNMSARENVANRTPSQWANFLHN